MAADIGMGMGVEGPAWVPRGGCARAIHMFAGSGYRHSMKEDKLTSAHTLW